MTLPRLHTVSIVAATATDGIRTHTTGGSLAPKASASTSSATVAKGENGGWHESNRWRPSATRPRTGTLSPTVTALEVSPSQSRSVSRAQEAKDQARAGRRTSRSCRFMEIERQARPRQEAPETGLAEASQVTQSHKTNGPRGNLSQGPVSLGLPDLQSRNQPKCVKYLLPTIYPFLAVQLSFDRDSVSR